MEMKPALGVDKYNYSTYTSIRMSYSLLDRGARALLHLLAFFHHSSICLESIRVASKYGYRGPEWDVVPREGQYRKHLTTLQKLLTPDGSWSDFNMDDLLNQAQSFSLISLNDASEHTSASIHPLTQSCILDTLSSEEFNLYFHMAALVLSTCSRDEEIPLFQYLTMHIAELESRKVDIHPTDMASFSYILYRGGQYEASLKRWEMVAEGSKKVNGEEHSSTLQALYRMADCLHFLDRSDEAEELSRSVTKTQERVLGLSDDRTINSYELLAEILTLKGKTKEAEDHLQKALVSNRNKYGEDHWRTFDIQSLLAANLFYQMRYTDGEQILKDILEPMKEALGEDDLITLYTLSTLSRGLMDHEKWDEAQTILDDLVEKRTRIYGSHHPFTLNSLYSSAICRSERGMFDEAKTIFSDILELQERSLGNDHADTIETRKALERIAGREELSKTTGSPNSTRLHMSLSPDFKPTSSFFQLEKSPVSLRSHGNGAPGQPARS
jgi:tetratricopeptide (TPR) repeat protein